MVPPSAATPALLPDDAPCEPVSTVEGTRSIHPGSSPSSGADHTGERIAGLTVEARRALSTIQGYAEILQEELEDEPEVVRDLGFIRQASVRLETLIAQLEDCATDARSDATRDPLTGIANRRYLFEVGDRMISDRSAMALVVLDVDQFKLINDRFGHHVGDDVLKMVVERFRFAVRERDLLARLAGDEFVAILPDADEQTALKVAQRLRHVLIDAPFVIRNRELQVTCSIGVAVRGPDHLDLTELIDTADRRMYRAKRGGRDQIAS